MRARNLSTLVARGLRAGSDVRAWKRMRKRIRTRRQQQLFDVVPMRRNRASRVRGQLSASPFSTTVHVCARLSMLARDRLCYRDAVSWPLPRRCVFDFLQLRPHRALSMHEELPASVWRPAATGPLPTVQRRDVQLPALRGRRRQVRHRDMSARPAGLRPGRYLHSQHRVRHGAGRWVLRDLLVRHQRPLHLQRGLRGRRGRPAGRRTDSRAAAAGSATSALNISR